VSMSDDPDWSPTDMSPEYRARLSARRAERRGSIRVVETPTGGAVRLPTEA